MLVTPKSMLTARSDLVANLAVTEPDAGRGPLIGET